MRSKTIESIVLTRLAGMVLVTFSIVSPSSALSAPRNHHSYAHDNDLLSSAASQFILNNVAAAARYLNELEARIVK